MHDVCGRCAYIRYPLYTALDCTLHAVLAYCYTELLRSFPSCWHTAAQCLLPTDHTGSGGITIDKICRATLSTCRMCTRKFEDHCILQWLALDAACQSLGECCCSSVHSYAFGHCMQPAKFCAVCSMHVPALHTRPLKRNSASVISGRCQTRAHRQGTC